MLKSIRSRLIASYLLVILLAMGVAAGLAWSALERAFLDVLRENLLAQARRVAQVVESGGAGSLVTADVSVLESAPYSQMSNLAPGFHMRLLADEGLVALNDLSVTSIITASDEMQRARQDGAPDRTYTPAELLDRPEIASALAGEAATGVRAFDWAPDRRILYAAYPVRAPDGSITSVAYVASPIPRFSLSLLPTTFGWQIAGGVGLAIALAGVAGVLLARRLTRPLRRLTDAAAALARGEPAPPIPPEATEELDRLGAAFNTMNTNLGTAHATLAAQARQRETILHGLADAVLAADAAGEIVLANPPASTLLEIAAAPLRDALRQTLAAGEPHAAEITARSQVYELLVTPLRGEDGRVSGAVAVGHDVTAYRQLDRLRTDFVSDVSHELRTPLTAIKGTVETLQDGAAEDPAARDGFLRTIAAETERLIRLTNDLLLLTRADAGRLDLRLAPVDLAECARQALDQLEAHAREKSITLTLESPDAPTLALVDADRVHQVLINLLDNAIKFTPAGGRVTVTVEAGLVPAQGDHEGRPYITVADSGPGIPAAEIPLVFERFYRGDRSRARAENESGAGLGLAIARAIVEAHGGRLWAESTPGHGTRFTFTLPPAA
jgi:signal transduction histidine kinase